MQEKEFLTLLEKEEGKLFRIAWSMLGQESDAWDALQEAVEQAWRQRKKIKGGADSFPAWIRKILITRTLNYIHRQKKIVIIEPDSMFWDSGSTPSPEQNVEYQEIWQAVDRLEIEQRQVVILRYIADLTLPQIAGVLDIPLGTAKSRLYRAREHLREMLNDRGGIYLGN